MARSNCRWTGADMLKLKDLAQKYPAATIAEQLGRSPTALAVKAHELQLIIEIASTWQNANVRWRSPTRRGLIFRRRSRPSAPGSLAALSPFRPHVWAAL